MYMMTCICRRLSQQVDLMENVDLSMTYLDRIDMKREEVMKAEESFPISEQGFVMR